MGNNNHTTSRRDPPRTWQLVTHGPETFCSPSRTFDINWVTLQIVENKEKQKYQVFGPHRQLGTRRALVRSLWLLLSSELKYSSNSLSPSLFTRTSLSSSLKVGVGIIRSEVSSFAGGRSWSITIFSSPSSESYNSRGRSDTVRLVVGDFCSIDLVHFFLLLF